MKKVMLTVSAMILIFLILAVGDADSGIYQMNHPAAMVYMHEMPEAEPTETPSARKLPLGERPKAGWLFGFCGVGQKADYYIQLENYLKGYIVENGDRFISMDTEDDSELQIKQLRKMAAKGVDAIFLIPVDVDAILPVLEELKAEKIPVIVMHQGMNDADKMLAMVDSDNFNSGFLLGDYMINHCKPGSSAFNKADVLVFSEKSDSFAKQKIYGFRVGIGDSFFQVGKEVQCTHEKEDIRKEMKAAAEELGDFRYVFSICDEMTLSILEICKEEGFDDLQVFTTGGSPEIKRKMFDGNKNLVAFAAESPISLAMNAYSVIYQYLDGQKIKKQYLTETFLVTRENLSDYSIKEWQ